MQLVLSNNRVIAHGENFLSLGGVVINTETGARYDNATITECEGCPTDINEVGYEYHAGVFVPCAPYGRGNNNGNFMEVCESCATPRDSGLPIKNIKWSTVESVTVNIPDVDSASNLTKNYTFPVTEELLSEYSMLRYVIKAGSTYNLSMVSANENNSRYNIPVVAVGGIVLHKAITTRKTASGEPTYNAGVSLVFDKDIVCPCYLTNAGYVMCDFKNPALQIIQAWTSNGVTVDPLTLSITLPSKYDDKYYSSASMVIDLEGRK